MTLVEWLAPLPEFHAAQVEYRALIAAAIGQDPRGVCKCCGGTCYAVDGGVVCANCGLIDESGWTPAPEPGGGELDEIFAEENLQPTELARLSAEVERLTRARDDIQSQHDEVNKMWGEAAKAAESAEQARDAAVALASYEVAVEWRDKYHAAVAALRFFADKKKWARQGDSGTWHFYNGEARVPDRLRPRARWTMASSAVRCNCCLCIFVADVDDYNLPDLGCPFCRMVNSLSIRSGIDSHRDAILLFASEERNAAPESAEGGG